MKVSVKTLQNSKYTVEAAPTDTVRQPCTLQSHRGAHRA
jgi:hypothetical protein